jgi:hypothetical protein
MRSRWYYLVDFLVAGAGNLRCFSGMRALGREDYCSTHSAAADAEGAARPKEIGMDVWLSLLPAGVSSREARGRGDEQSLEFDPQRIDALVRCQMPAKGAVALIRIAVESYVLSEEMPEGLEERPVPMACCQDCAEDTFEPAILVTCQSHRSRGGVEPISPMQITKAKLGQDSATIVGNFVQLERSPHEFIVVHFFARLGNTWPGRKIVGVALSSVELLQLLIVRIEAECNFEALTELH